MALLADRIESILGGVTGIEAIPWLELKTVFALFHGYPSIVDNLRITQG